MKFRKLKIKNIRSYKDQELEFPDGSLLLAGDIGSGKTTILLAIEYALFGLQPGQKGNALLRNNSDEGSVSLEIEVNGKNIILERRLKRTQKGVSNDYACITINGEKNESSITEIKSKVLENLGYPPEYVKRNNTLYRYTVYTPQENMKQIIQEDAESRLNILRHIFGMDKYKKIKENLSILLSNLKNESKFLQGSLSSVEELKENLKNRNQRVSELNSKLEENNTVLRQKSEIRKKVESEISEVEDKIREKQAFEKELEKNLILIGMKRDTINSVESELMDAKITLSEIKPFDEVKYSKILESVVKFRERMEQLSQYQASINEKINSLKIEQQNLNIKRDRIFKIDICPTCLQDVPENHRHNILNASEKQLSDTNSKLKNLNLELELARKKISEVRSELNSKEDEKIQLDITKSKLGYLEKTRERIISLEKQRKILEEDTSLLAQHVTSLRQNVSKFTEFENLFKRKNMDLQQAALDEKNIEIALATLRREIELSQKEILNLEVSIKEKEEAKKKLYKIQEISDWLSSRFLELVEFSERNFLLKIREEFSRLFRNWFSILVPGETISLRIDEKFTPIIIQGEVEMDYTYLSGGERTAVALAYRLALNQTINSVLSKIQTKGLIILDEPTDGFSDSQVDKIRDLLEELNSEQLIIVSHEQKIEGFVDSVLKVSKHGDTSLIETAHHKI